MLDQYLKMQVETATPGELLLMVYEGAIRSLEKAKLKLSKNSIEEATELLFKAQDAIAELIGALNLEAGEVANSLYNLYSFMLRKLNDAAIKKQKNLIDEVIGLLNSLKEAWEEVVKRGTKGIVVQA